MKNNQNPKRFNRKKKSIRKCAKNERQAHTAKPIYTFTEIVFVDVENIKEGNPVVDQIIEKLKMHVSRN